MGGRIVRELIAADGSAEHLRMQIHGDEMFHGYTALDFAKKDEIKALLAAAVSAADAGAAAPPPEGKAREGDEENEEEDSPPPSQGGAQPKKTLPRPVYEGDAATLVKILLEAARAGTKPDITKIRELLDAGIGVLHQVRVSCVCALVVVVVVVYPVCVHWW